MEYKYHSDDFKGRDVEATEREGAPNRHAGVHHPGAMTMQPYKFEPISNSKDAMQQYEFGPISIGKPGFSHPYAMDSLGLDMPARVKSKTVEAEPPCRSKIEDLYNAHSKPIALPRLQEMPIVDLKYPYQKSQVIILTKPDGLTEDERNNYVRETFGISYGVLQILAPALTFKPNQKNLKCKGSFTHDFCTCGFEAQIWRVAGGEQNIHIYELRQNTVSGIDAFEYLIRHMGVALKEAGRARKYGNDVDICPPVQHLIPDDLGELSMPSFGGIGSHTTIPHRNDVMAFPLTLDNGDQMKTWCEIITERKWPIYEETLRILARCCVNSGNRNILAEHPDIQKALIKELQLGVDVTSCHNALTIMFAILEEASVSECYVEDGILLAVARTLMTHSGLKQQRGAPKIIRSVALERAALKVLMLLSEDTKHYKQKQMRTVLEVLEACVTRKLKDEVNQGHLKYIISNLKMQ